MDYKEERHVERIGRKKVFSGAIVDFYQDEMLLPDGKHETWDFVSHRKGAAAVLAVREDGKLLMVRQYRPALNRWTLEIPAGSRDSVEEDTHVTAKRELREETGYEAESLEKLLSLKTTVAFCDEFIDVYLAEGLKRRTSQDLDEAEVINVEAWELSDLLKLVFDGTIQDSKTVSSVLAYQVLLNRRNEGEKE